MDMYPKILENQIDELNKNLKSLNDSIKESSKTSNSLQKWLIFWTAVMAFAVLGQIITIILTSFFIN
jgi:hypothetical protein